MAKIIRKPVFEEIDSKWQLVTLDCPLCLNGTLEVLQGIEYHLPGDVKYAACDECHIVVSWHPWGDSPEWRVL